GHSAVRAHPLWRYRSTRWPPAAATHHAPPDARAHLGIIDHPHPAEPVLRILGIRCGRSTAGRRLRLSRDGKEPRQPGTSATDASGGGHHRGTTDRSRRIDGTYTEIGVKKNDESSNSYPEHNDSARRARRRRSLRPHLLRGIHPVEPASQLPAGFP